ncbi:MAG TPA: MaoC family dehydratase N-terminal domain-containing protein [Baekduia sp.]
MTGDRCLAFVYAAGREKIREFAHAVGETDPRFFDVAAARDAGFADVVAPLMFVAVYAGPAFREALWSPALGVDRSLTVHGAQEFAWAAPVVAGDELTTRTALVDDAAAGRHRRLVLRTTSVNQRGETAAVGTWTVLERGAART